MPTGHQCHRSIISLNTGQNMDIEMSIHLFLGSIIENDQCHRSTNEHLSQNMDIEMSVHLFHGSISENEACLGSKGGISLWAVRGLISLFLVPDMHVLNCVLVLDWS